ncbi:MAG TPA: hypothetical protein VFO70_01445, partial [Chitinophagaceae bacterium]|nr:hypothetical protein [Chitinophagaceae bacterium]
IGEVVGYETSGGEYSGNGFKILNYILPNSGIEFGFPYVRILYSNGGSKSGRGLFPNYEIHDNYESFKKNADRQVNYIIDTLLEKN